MRLIVFDHHGESHRFCDGDEDELKEWLNKLFPWLGIRQNENLQDILEDLNSNQHYEAILQEESEELEKGTLPALALAAAMSGPPNFGADRQQATEQTEMAPWTPRGLHEDLIPIAHLESSFGQNTRHAENSKGEYHTAHGAVGFKPVTAHEEFKNSKALQKVFGALKDPADFMAKFKNDHEFYNLVASVHFRRLTQRHGSPEKAAFAWRWGTGAAERATDDEVANDLYVQKYKALRLKVGLQKSELLQKMPYQDPSWGDSDSARYLAEPRGFKASEYEGASEIVPGYYLHRYKAPHGGNMVTFHLRTTDQPVHTQYGPTDGHISGYPLDGGFQISTTVIHPSHQKKGLGAAAYKHIASLFGGKILSGGSQSPEADKLWNSLAKDPEVDVSFGAKESYEHNVMQLK